MVVALSTGQELGLAGVAAAFIVFALVVAFLLPRRDPNFPGRRLPLFVAVTVLFFAAMMTAVVVLAREEEEEGARDEPAATETNAGTQTGTQPSAEGDPQAGADVFASAGCGGCHTLEEAGSSGAVGPALDGLDLDFDSVVRQVTDGSGAMPPFGDRLSEQQIRDVAAFVVEASAS